MGHSGYVSNRERSESSRVWRGRWTMAQGHFELMAQDHSGRKAQDHPGWKAQDNSGRKVQGHSGWKAHCLSGQGPLRLQEGCQFSSLVVERLERYSGQMPCGHSALGLQRHHL